MRRSSDTSRRVRARQAFDGNSAALKRRAMRTQHAQRDAAARHGGIFSASAFAAALRDCMIVAVFQQPRAQFAEKQLRPSVDSSSAEPVRAVALAASSAMQQVQSYGQPSRHPHEIRHP